jgi:addiction module HigA family antidote
MSASWEPSCDGARDLIVMDYTSMGSGMLRSHGTTHSAHTKSGSKGAEKIERSDRLIPAPPLSPGDALRSFILGDDSKITQDELADAMQVSRLTVNQIINGRRSVTADMALRLARVTSTSPDVWLNLQMAVDLYKAKLKLADRLGKLVVLRAPKSKRQLFARVRRE